MEDLFVNVHWASQRSIGLWGMIGRFSWALQDVPLHETTFPYSMEQHGVPVVHICLFPMEDQLW